MSTFDLWNAVKRIVEPLMASMPQPRRGIIQSVDTGTMRAKVLIQPEGALSGWLPLFGQAVGSGWGLVAVPDIGAQALIVPCDGYAESSVVVGGQWSNAQQPPSGFSVGEMWLWHKTGAKIQLLNTGAFALVDQKGATVQTDGNGKLTLQDQSGTKLVFNNDGQTATFTGKLIVTGEIIGGSGQLAFTTHEHTGVQTGADDTGGPVNPIG